jgi:hypothetical protein
VPARLIDMGRAIDVTKRLMRSPVGNPATILSLRIQASGFASHPFEWFAFFKPVLLFRNYYRRPPLFS